MKTLRCAESNSQLSESFVRELQMHGVMANNLAIRKKSNLKMDEFNAWNFSPEFFYLQDEEGDTQLHHSIILERTDLAMLLISIAPNTTYLDIVNDECLTALHYAVLLGQPRIVRKLILAGANLQARTNQGDTALHLAVKEGHVSCIKALSEPLSTAEKDCLAKSNVSRPTSLLPVHVDVRNYVGQSPLHIAASKNDVQLVHELLLIGADPNVKEGLGGKTALHLAIENNNAAVVHYLAQIPTTLSATTYGGETAYQVAMESHSCYMDVLLRCGAAPVIHNHDDDSMSEDDGDYGTPLYVQYSNAPLVTV